MHSGNLRHPASELSWLSDECITITLVRGTFLLSGGITETGYFPSTDSISLPSLLLLSSLSGLVRGGQRRSCTEKYLVSHQLL